MANFNGFIKDSRFLWVAAPVLVIALFGLWVLPVSDSASSFSGLAVQSIDSPGLADLVIKDVQVKDSGLIPLDKDGQAFYGKINHNEFLNLEFIMENKGVMDSGSSFTEVVLTPVTALGPPFKMMMLVGPIKAGAAMPVSTRLGGLSPGDYRIDLTADANRQVPEMNRLNNKYRSLTLSLADGQAQYPLEQYGEGHAPRIT